MSLCRAARVSGIALAATLILQACGPKVAPASPPPPGQPQSTGYICDKNNPGPITIPVTVANHATDTTKCAAAAPDATACPENDVHWEVTNNCTRSDRIKVSVGFDPFDDGDQRLTTRWLPKTGGRDTITKKVRKNVRKSKDTPAPAFKYDIYIRYDRTQNYELTTDPEIEIDY